MPDEMFLTTKRLCDEMNRVDPLDESRPKYFCCDPDLEPLDWPSPEELNADADNQR